MLAFWTEQHEPCRNMHTTFVTVFVASSCPITAKCTNLGTLSLFARNKVLGLMTFIKNNAAIKRGPSTPVYYLLQPALALHL